MRIHILGVGGTFMGSLAILAKALGHDITGVDGAIYEPMASNLVKHGIQYANYLDDPWLQKDVIDQVIVGNALSRGHPSIEWLLNSDISYTSGPAWLAQHVLRKRKVVAVAGTHGKTTVSALVAWLLRSMGHDPGYFIGGVPHDLPSNVALGRSDWFVIESDEYDSAFFDKRPKFIHYKPTIGVINNIEFDHADIYEHIEAIEQQFGYFLRNIPSKGHVITDRQNANVQTLLKAHPWMQQHVYGGENQWLSADFNQDKVILNHADQQINMTWPLVGRHNQQNLLSAIAVLLSMGLDLAQLPDLSSFHGVKRRLEMQYESDGLKVYSDFGHHPTAIRLTLEGLKQQFPSSMLTAMVHMTSNSMHSGAHDQALQGLWSIMDRGVLVCENEQAEKRVATWILPAHISLTQEKNLATDMEAIALREQPVPRHARKSHVVVVFSNKNVAPLIEAVLPKASST